MYTFSTSVELDIDVEYSVGTDRVVTIESIKSKGKDIDAACISQYQLDQMQEDLDEEVHFNWLNRDED